MRKGFIQLGNLIFIVLLIVMIFAAGYLYFFSDQGKIVADVVTANTELKAQIKFTHPIYQYSLDLPYSWKGKYRVIESENQTNFWYIDDSGRSDLLFSVKRQPIGGLIAPAGESKKLGQSADFLYVLIIPKRISEALSLSNSQMRREVAALGETFSLLDRNQSDLEIIKVLAGNFSTSSPADIKFSTFEIIATQENHSSTEYYIWFYRRHFAWDGFRLRDWPVESQPALITITKDNQLASLRVPREGSNFNADLKKIFPDSVRKSAIFIKTSPEHGIMLEKLSNRLDEMINLYFGSEPVLTRAGFIGEIKAGQGGINLKVSFAELAKLSASSTYIISDINKTMSQLFVSSSTEPLFLPAMAVKNKLGAIISSTTPQTLPLSEWSGIFSKTSTSAWRKKAFWFEMLDGQVLRVYSIN